MKLLILILLIYFYICYLSNNIEKFSDHIDIDDFQYIPTKGKFSNNMLNNYYIKLIPEIEKESGFLLDVHDYMGLDSHHYLFESPHIDNKDYIFNKNIDAYYGIDDESNTYARPITYPDESSRRKFYENERELNKFLINEPLQYRHPSLQNIGNKIIYDFSNSLDFVHELRERELRLRGFRRSNLTEEDDYLSMTFCDDIDEEGTDFPCHKFGKQFNYDLEDRLKLAKYRDPKTHPNMDPDLIKYINDISTNICCK